LTAVVRRGRVVLFCDVARPLEGHYRRWLGDFDGLNEIGFGIGLGGIIGAAGAGRGGGVD